MITKFFNLIKKREWRGYGLNGGLSKHIASAVTLPKLPPGIDTLPDTTAVAVYPFPVASGCDDFIVAFPVTINEPPVVKSPGSQVAVEMMVEFAVPADPAVVLPTTV